MNNLTSSSSCPEIPEGGFARPLQDYYNDPNYDIKEFYETTVTMERVYWWTPRWNLNTNISLLLDEEAPDDEQDDYLKGLLWTSFAFMLLLLVWLLLLVIFKFCGPAKVGFLSARRLRPPLPEEPTEALEKRELMYRQQERKEKQKSGAIPFQHNGMAFEGHMNKSMKKRYRKFLSTPIKAPTKLVKGTIKAPKKFVSKARKQKRKLEEQFSKTKKFSRMNSGEFEVETDDTEGGGDGGDQSTTLTSINSPSTRQQQTQQQQQPGNMEDEESEREEGDGEEEVVLMTQEDQRLLAQFEIDLKEYIRICEERNARLRRLRVTVAFCAIGIVVAVVLFIVMGMTSLIPSINITETGIQELQLQAASVQEELQVLQSQQQEASNATEKFILQVNEMCPNVATSFCTNVNNATIRDCDFSSFPQLEPELDTILAYLDGTFELVLERKVLEEMEQDLETLQGLLREAEKYYPTTLNWVFWTAVGCNAVLALICLAICAAVMLLYFGHPLPQSLKCLRSFFMVPFFLFFVVLGWIFTTVFITGALGMADSCINSPDAVALALLELIEDDFVSNSVIHDFLVHYVRRCPVETAPRDLDQRIVIMTKLIVPALTEVTNAVKGLGTSLQSLCGKDMTPFMGIVTALERQLCELSESLVNVRLLLKCPDWYEVYQSIAHNGMCYYSTTGLGWAASTQLVMVVLSMIILTLRVSYYELNEVADYGSGKCTNDWCCCVEVVEDPDDDSSESESGKDDEDGDGYSSHSERSGNISNHS